MKLQTRIIWISCISVLAATIIIDIVIWIFYQNMLNREALEVAYQTTYENWQEFEDYLSYPETSAANTNELAYFIKQQRNDYLICVRKFENVDSESVWYEEIFNHTLLSVEDINKENFISYRKMSYARYTYEQTDFLIFEAVYGNGISLYWLEDISYVQNRLNILTVLMLGITVITAAIVSAILYYVMRKAFSPLAELSASAKSIAEGDYVSRIQTKQQDEIGMLAENFNQMAEAVEQRTKSLEESERKKTLFMGNLTHELKTPMTAISGYAETLLMAKLEPEEEEAALQYIYSECGRLERLSRKMMQLLELDQREELVLEEHSVKELFEAAESSCCAVLSGKDMHLNIEEHGERFSMDLDLMTDVIVNLIDNAGKASKAGGDILLQANTDAKGQVYILVEDFGCGIPAEEQDKIIEPFYMVDKSRSRKNGGAGLGMALIKLILDYHNMQLEIESEVDVGTKIKLCF